MQEAIIDIGSIILSKGDMLESLVQELPTEKKGKILHVVKFNFNTKEDSLVIDVKEEMSDSTANKYMFLGKAGGPNSPQWFSSSTSSNYFLTETFFNLKNIDFGEQLNKNIEKIFNNFYVDLGEKIKDKYRYVLNLKKYEISDKRPMELYNELKEEGGEDKKIIDKLKKALEDYIKDNFGIKGEEIGLYTILIDKKPLSDYKQYKKAVLNSKTDNGKKKKDEHRVCSLCAESEGLSFEFPTTKIKFYTTNQLIFASNIDKKNYYKNMMLCSSCLNKLLAGETYIINNLSTRLAGFNVYIIPHFVYGETISKEDLALMCSNIKNSFNTVKNIKSIEELKEEGGNLLENCYEQDYFLLNFIFYKTAQQSTKIQRLIKDVNSSIFEKINSSSKDAYKLFKDIFNEAWKRTIGLESIYYLTPVKTKAEEAQQYKNLLSIYDAIFTGRRINKNLIIKNILEVVSIIQHEKQGFNVNYSGNSIHKTIMDGNMLIKFLENMGCIKEGEGMDIDSLNVKEHIKNYIKKMNYDEQQTGMFLLGCLIGEIGNAQYSRSTSGRKEGENTSEVKKPILNKLNYSGIDRSKIIRLSLEVFNKLRQEKILKYNEITFNEFKRLIDSNINKWKLNKQENLFYLLSGYGYASTKPILNKQNGGNDNE